MGALLEHHLCLLKGLQLELNGLVTGLLEIGAALVDVSCDLLTALLACQNVLDQLVIVTQIGLEHLLELAVGLLDLGLVLFELDVDLIDLVAHGAVLIQDLVQLLAHVGEQAAEESGVFADLLDVELVHDLAQCGQHRARIIDLAHVHAAQHRVRALGDLGSHLTAKPNDGLEVVHLDGGYDVVNFLGTGQRLCHLGAIVLDVVRHDFHPGVLRLCGRRTGCAGAEIDAHKCPLLKNRVKIPSFADAVPPR